MRSASLVTLALCAGLSACATTSPALSKAPQGAIEGVARVSGSATTSPPTQDEEPDEPEATEPEAQASVSPALVSPGEEAFYSVRLPDAADTQIEVVPPSFGELEAVPMGRVRHSAMVLSKEGINVEHVTWSQGWWLKAPREGVFTLGPAEVRWNGRVEKTEAVQLTSAATAAVDPRLSASLSPDHVSLNTPVMYELKVENAAATQFVPPNFGALRVEGPEKVEQSTIISSGDGRAVRTTFYKWRLTAPFAGRHTIGPASVTRGGKSFTSEALELNVVGR